MEMENHMNAYTKAVDIIRAHTIDNLGFDSPVAYTESERLANALADAEVLLDLPAPDLEADDPEWQDKYKADWDYPAPNVWTATAPYEVGVFPDDLDITLWIDHIAQVPLDIDEARDLGLALLAAAEHAEQEKE